jgi:hypothetical protein
MSRQVSHSEISTYLDCQKKWELQYVKGLRVDNVHFQFGSMGHSVLETRNVPDETLYPNLKEQFEIKSWQNYFTLILKEIDDYFADYVVLQKEFRVETDDIKGVIDVVLQHKETGKILIVDYKFSNSEKGYEDILLDEQMVIYAVVYASKNNLSLSDIEIGYVNITKKEPDKPRVLKNGTLSKDKAQNTTYDLYLKTINDLCLNINDYADVLEDIKNKKLTSFCKSTINEEMAVRIMKNIDNTIKDMEKGYVLEKCSFMCKRCEFLEYCKYGKKIE